MVKKKIKIQYHTLIYSVLIVTALLIGFNQFMIININSGLGGGTTSLFGSSSTGSDSKSTFTRTNFEDVDLSNVDISQIQSTAQAISALYDFEGVDTEEELISLMIPTGVPEYSEAIGGLSYDDPVSGLDLLADSYPALKQQIKENEPATWDRYLNLAAKPTGISCEFCCGLGAQGITDDGELMCGCAHMPAVHTLTMWLMQNTDYSDAEVLKEVMKWKTLFFPKNMIGLANQIAGGDTSVLENLPGMVGGC